MPTPQEVHGDGNCYICGKPMAGAGSEYCSYPHGRVPDQPVGGGMWTWKLPDDSSALGQAADGSREV